MQVRRINTNLLLLIIFVWLSCRGKTNEVNATTEAISTDPISYITDIQKSTQLKNEKVIGEVKYSVTHIPNEVEALKRIEWSNYSKDSLKNYLEKFKLEYADVIFLNYRIELEGNNGSILKECLANFTSNHDLVYYCSFLINNDLYLVSANDTISAPSMIFDQTYEISKSLNFTVCFNRKLSNSGSANQQEFTVVIDDKLFRNGILKFELI